MEHVLAEVTLDLPHDHVLTHVVTAPIEAGQTFAANLVVSRDRLHADEDLRAYVDRQLVELAKRLKKFRLHGRRDVEVGSTPAIELSCGWLGTQGPLEQRLTFVARESGVLTFTATSTKARADKVLPVFEEIVRTARLP